jgi:hypothetical protein
VYAAVVCVSELPPRIIKAMAPIATITLMMSFM